MPLVDRGDDGFNAERTVPAFNFPAQFLDVRDRFVDLTLAPLEPEGRVKAAGIAPAGMLKRRADRTPAGEAALLG
jgi:hypothetical protein